MFFFDSVHKWEQEKRSVQRGENIVSHIINNTHKNQNFLNQCFFSFSEGIIKFIPECEEGMRLQLNNYT